jgi:hypothetical protein
MATLAMTLMEWVGRTGACFTREDGDDDDEFYIALNLYRAHSLRVTVMMMIVFTTVREDWTPSNQAVARSRPLDLSR